MKTGTKGPKHETTYARNLATRECTLVYANDVGHNAIPENVLRYQNKMRDKNACSLEEQIHKAMLRPHDFKGMADGEIGLHNSPS